MMARRVPGILPPLTFDEALEVTAVHSVAGLLQHGSGLVPDRPFRAPHHTISNVALVGGGSPAAARRGQPRSPRRAVSRRDAGVSSRRARGPASAARGRTRHDRARRPDGHVSCALRPRRRDESVSVRIRRRSGPRLPLHAAADRAVSRSPLRTAARSIGSHRRRAGGSARRSRRRRAGRIVGSGPGASRRRARAASASAPAREGVANERRPHAAADGRCTAASIPAGCDFWRAPCSDWVSRARGYDRVRKVARTIADLAGAERRRSRPHRRSVAVPDDELSVDLASSSLCCISLGSKIRVVEFPVRLRAAAELISF